MDGHTEVDIFVAKKERLLKLIQVSRNQLLMWAELLGGEEHQAQLSELRRKLQTLSSFRFH
jgi:hypothetical protein